MENRLARRRVRHTRGRCDALAEVGAVEPHAKAIAGVVRDGRAGLATKADLDAAVSALRSDIYRALWMQGAGIVAIMMALKAFG